MINKEVILDSTGGIRKDFAKRGIPQYSNNYVHVNFLIPQDVFTELDNYTVQVAASITAQSQTTTLPTLYAFASKTLKIDDINYIKYSVILSSLYTEKRGALKLSPSVYEVRTTQSSGQVVTQLVNRKAYVYTQLDVVESVDATYDNSLDNPTMAVALSNAIDAKHIAEIEVDGESIAEIAYQVANNYSTPYYNGWILKNTDKMQMFVPYIGSEDETNLIYLDYANGILYELTNIWYNVGTNAYFCDVRQLSFSKEEVETLLSDKISDVNYADGYFTKTKHDHETNTDSSENIVSIDTLADDMGFTSHIQNNDNPHNVNKTQVGLGNVSNYTITDNYTIESSYSYASSKALYEGLLTKVNLSTFNQLYNQVQGISALIGDPGNPDEDSIVNKLVELIQAFQDYDETSGTVLSILNSKATKVEFNELSSDVTSLTGRVTTLETRVDAIDQDTYGLVILTPQDNVNLLTLTPSEFVDNDMLEYAEDYQYKTVLTSDAFKGASDFSIVFDAETAGLFRPLSILDNIEGTITLFISEMPTNNIVIVKIRLIQALSVINGLIADLATRTTAAENDIASLIGITNNIQSDYVKKEYRDVDDLDKRSKITNNKNEVLVEVSKKFADNSDRLRKSTVQAATDGIILTNIYNANNEPTQTTSILLSGNDGLQGQTDKLLSFTKNYYLSGGLDEAYMKIKSNNEKLILSNEISDTPTDPNTTPTMSSISLGTNQLDIVYKDKSNNATQESSIKLYPNYINTKVVSDQGAYTIISQGPTTLGISKNDSSNNGLAGISIFNDATHTLRLYSSKLEFSCPIPNNITTGDYYNSFITDQGMFMNFMGSSDVIAKPVAIIDDSATSPYSNATYSRTEINSKLTTVSNSIPTLPYKHTIVLRRTGASTGGVYAFVLENSSSTVIDTGTKLYNALIAAGYGQASISAIPAVENANFVLVTGYGKTTYGAHTPIGVSAYNDKIVVYGALVSENNIMTRDAQLNVSDVDSSWTVTDNNPHQ